MLAHTLAMLPAFLAYFGVGAVLIAGFLLIYLNITPYDDITLIRRGNTAAAVSLCGAMLGFVLPVANVIAHSDGLLDLAVWGLIAGVIQLITYLLARLTLPHMVADIPAGRMASAVFLAGLSLTVGLLNAACMT